MFTEEILEPERGLVIYPKVQLENGGLRLRLKLV